MSKRQTTRRRKNAVTRLMRDNAEWIKCKNEFPCIEAVPLDDDIFEWHCNICPDSGDFANIIFHLIIYFDDNYPIQAPDIKLCTTIPHPNVFGDFICLDMIKEYNNYKIGKKYQGWTPGYSVTSLLMQLQSFLFEQKYVDQMEGNYSVKRSFNKNRFEKKYMPKIRKFKCDECSHCYEKPFPVTLSILTRLGLNDVKDDDSETKYSDDNNCSSIKLEISKKTVVGTVGKRQTKRKSKKNKRKKKFMFWDQMCHDLERLIISYFNVKDLMKLKRVSTNFKLLVINSRIIQKDSVRCWFHRSLMLPKKQLCFNNNNDNFNDTKMTMLCLGYGVEIDHFESQTPTKLNGQLFGSLMLGNYKSSQLRTKIGHLSMIKSIDTTFDLLSSDAFENFGIRKTVFNDRKFKYFIPMYINKKHGKNAIKQMNTFVLDLWHSNSSDSNNNSKKNNTTYEYDCHPWLKLYTIANMMKSLIVSVMNKSDQQNGTISLHYSIKVLETFFRLHHTLLAIYFEHKQDINAMLQYQIQMFFDKKSNGDYPYRYKEYIPDFGVFLAYFTLWENQESYSWQQIANELLDETFIRQVKWILNGHNGLVDEKYCSLKDRVWFIWKTQQTSNRLFMFNSFFFRQCCKLGNNKHNNKKNTSLEEQFNLYNANYGLPYNWDRLAYKLQTFVKHIHCNVNSFEQFFSLIGVKYPGMTKLGEWFINCMYNSQYRGYHKPHFYRPRGRLNKYNPFIRENKRKEWILQQLKEQQSYYLKQEKHKRRLIQNQQSLQQLQIQQSQTNMPVEASISICLMKRDSNAPIASNVLPHTIEEDECDYIRVFITLTQSSFNINQIASLDEIFIDGFAPQIEILETIDGYKYISDKSKKYYGVLYDAFANNENNTMSRNDLKNYMIHYNVGQSYININDKIDKLFDIYTCSQRQDTFSKRDFFDFYRNASSLEKCTKTHFPDFIFDGDFSIAVKKHKLPFEQNQYYADLPTFELFKHLNNLHDIRLRIKGKYNDGSILECVSLTFEEAKNRLLLEKESQQFQIDCLKEKINSISQYGQSKKIAIKSLHCTDYIPDKLIPFVEFSISTIKNGIISHNVTSIDLNCQTVRVIVKIATNKENHEENNEENKENKENETQCNDDRRQFVKYITGIYFDGKYHCKWIKQNSDKPIFTSYLNNQIKKRKEFVYYCDFCMQDLIHKFGKLGLINGIIPRIKGLTINNTQFYCCGGNEYLIYFNKQSANNEETTTCTVTQNRKDTGNDSKKKKRRHRRRKKQNSKTDETTLQLQDQDSQNDDEQECDEEEEDNVQEDDQQEHKKYGILPNRKRRKRKRKRKNQR